MEVTQINAQFPTVTNGKIGDGETPTVNARKLHKFLQVTTQFKDWIARRIQDYGFEEGKDFCSFLSESSGGRPAKEYTLSFNMAKELSMAERNERGKIAYRHFETKSREILLKSAQLPVTIQTTQNEPLTMSSRDIAALTGKQHKDVLRDIRKMLDELNERNFAPVEYTDSKGEKRPEYHLPKRETLILVSGYNITLRARIIDRWQELEEQIAKPDISKVLNDPATLRNLLLENVEKVLALETRVKELEPAQEALDRIANTQNTTCITDTAKILHMKPKSLFSYLVEHKWIYKRQGKSGYLAYQSKLDDGLLEHKVITVLTADGTENTYDQVRVTPKGLIRLAKLIKPALQEVA